MFGALNIAICRSDELGDDAFDVVAHIACLRERRGIADGQRHVEQLGERLDEVGLARARGAEHEDVALLNLYVGLLVGLRALVVVVRRHGHDLLCLLLADHVVVEHGVELVRQGHRLHDGLVRVALGALFLPAAEAEGAATTGEEPGYAERPGAAFAFTVLLVFVASGLAVLVDGLAFHFLDGGAAG